MKYHQILHDDMRNGDGLRVVLFVSGCDHGCKNCHNPITWNPNDGLPFTKKEISEIYLQMSQDHISGLTLSGGDPLHFRNRETIAGICKYFKSEFQDKTIWCYTGYLFEEVKDLPAMQYIDVLIDGEFKQELADVNCKWRGSTNQKIWRKIDGVWRQDDD